MHHTHHPRPAHTSCSSPPDSPVNRITLQCLAWLCLLGLLINSPAWGAEQESTAGRMQLSDVGGSTEAILLQASMQVTVTGLLAEMSLTQTFKNTTGRWVEGSYQFPLHEESAISALTMQIGERRIVGKIQPKADAQQTYDKARDAGQIASMIEQNRPNLFVAKVANIGPNEEITVQLDIVLPVAIEKQRVQLQLPTTLTPRYSNGTAHNPSTDSTAFGRPSTIRGPRFDLTVKISPLSDSASISSSTHDLQTTLTGVSISDKPMDRDVIISWPATLGQETTSQAFVTQYNGERYAQILVYPPQSSIPLADDNSDNSEKGDKGDKGDKGETGETGENDLISRELILVIDKSGSMAGVSIKAAKEALYFALSGLTAEDHFNIIAFDDQTNPLFTQALPVSERTLQQAYRFIDRLQADGGTEMQEALDLALQVEPLSEVNQDRAIPNTNKRMRQVVFITDGSIDFEDALLARIKRQLGNSRLFTIGIGPAPNVWFLEKAAESGRGLALRILNEQDIAGPMNRLFDSLRSPVLTDIAVQYPTGSAELYPNPIPDLYADKPILLVSRISSDVDEILLMGNYQGKRWTQTLSLPQAETATETAPTAAMFWARKKIESWMDEQRNAVDQDLHKAAITQLAMDTGLVTRYTSFVAVEEKVSKPLHETTTNHVVPNLLPAGNDMVLVGMPQSAAGVDTLLAVSLLLGISGLLLVNVHNRQSR